MSSVFGRLGFNFDSAKFGDGLFLTDAAKKTLNAAPVSLSSWQTDDIANDVVTRSRYYKNPHTNIIVTLSNTANILASQANTANFFSLEAASLSFVSELQAFKSHTDNVSGVSSVTSEDANIPNYDLATAVGTQILKITNVTDDVANATPMLGSMTSLFIGEELASNNTILLNNYNLLVNSAITESAALANVNMANTMIATRRTGDWSFYTNSREILNDYIFISRFSSLGNTQSYMIQNLIGTDLLKTNLSLE